MKSINKKKIFYWLLPIGYIGLIFTLSSIKTPYVYNLNKLSLDKIFHLIEYMVLAIILCKSFRVTIDFSNRKIFWIVFSIGIIIAMTDEYYQSFVAGRQSSIYDFTADALGILIGSWIYLRKAYYDRD